MQLAGRAAEQSVQAGSQVRWPGATGSWTVTRHILCSDSAQYSRGRALSIRTDSS